MLLPINRTCQDCYSLPTATKFLGLKNPQYARIFLGSPDIIEKGKTAKRYLYFPETVVNAKRKLEEKRLKAKSQKGKRSCYCCRKKFYKDELTCGMCLMCKAVNIVANFACKGDCLCNSPEYRRFCILREAIARYGEEIRVKAMAEKK